MPEAKELCGNNGWTFMNDGARAKKTKQWLEEQKVTPQSQLASKQPDLNVMETIWGIVKQEIQRREPKPADEIWQVAKETWDDIPLRVLKRQVSGWGRRRTFCGCRKSGRTPSTEGLRVFLRIVGLPNKLFVVPY